MPDYQVIFNVNVPGLGDRNVVQVISAPDIIAAIKAATDGVIITPLQVKYVVVP